MALLSYVSKHRNDRQSLRVLADECGIPLGTLCVILNYHREHGKKPCYLCITATKYNYSFVVYKEGREQIIDVVYNGPCRYR